MVAATISMRRGPVGEAPVAGPAPNGVARVAGGGFGMGSRQPQFLEPDPSTAYGVDGFCIEKVVVTASQLEAFAAVSGAAARMRPDVSSNASCWRPTK